jgi:hypothetical protein
LVSGTHLGPMFRFLVLSDSCVYVDVCWSLTTGRICNLRLLLRFASAVILESQSHSNHDHILLSQIWDPPNLEGQVPVLISPRNWAVQLLPQALGIAQFTHSLTHSLTHLLSPASLCLTTLAFSTNWIFRGAVLAWQDPRHFDLLPCEQDSRFMRLDSVILNLNTTVT